MGFVEKFNFFGTEAKQIPCICGEGMPTTETEGAVGCLYMDTLTGETYKCVAVADSVYTWVSTKDYVTPEMYGAKGDGKTDDTAALQAAFDSGYTVYLGKKVYRTTEQLTITKEGTTIRGEGSIRHIGTDSAAIVVATLKVKIDMDRVESNATAVLLDGNAAYISRCNININTLIGKIGLHLRCNNGSITHNDFHIEIISATDVGVLVWADNKYINENAYYINHIYNCNVGVYLHGDHSLNANGGYGTNDNKFFNTSFEGIKSELSDTSDYTSGLSGTCSIYIDHSYGNVFRTCRTAENFGQKKIVFKSSCNRNNFEISDIKPSQIDISELTVEDSQNVIHTIISNSSARGYKTGYEVMVHGDLGMVYNPIYGDDNFRAVTLDLFPDKVLGAIDGEIPTAYMVQDESTTGETFTLHAMFSAQKSVARGFPITFYFGGKGTIKLLDSLGNTILDNSDGAFAYKSVSVRWCGYNPSIRKNLWDVTVAEYNIQTQIQTTVETYVEQYIREALGGEY